MLRARVDFDSRRFLLASIPELVRRSYKDLVARSHRIVGFGKSNLRCSNSLSRSCFIEKDSTCRSWMQHRVRISIRSDPFSDCIEHIIYIYIYIYIYIIIIIVYRYVSLRPPVRFEWRIRGEKSNHQSHDPLYGYDLVDFFTL